MRQGAFGLALLVGMATAAPATQALPDQWTGASVGVHAGGLSGDFFGDYNSADAPLEFEEIEGWQPLIGVQGEYLFQFGFPLVLGAGVDFSHAFLDGDEISGADGDTLSARVDFLASLQLKAGFPYRDFLFYGTTGIAFASYRADITDAATGQSARADEGNAAPFFGAGVRYRVSPRWSAFGEGLYYAFDDVNDTEFSAPDSDAGDEFGLGGITVFRLGASFHF
jgi:opacity protein-like surface antigen